MAKGRLKLVAPTSVNRTVPRRPPTHAGAPNREGGRASDQGRESSWLGDDPLQKLVLVSGQLIEKFIPALLPTELVTMPPVPNEPELGCPAVGATWFLLHLHTKI